MRSDWSAVRRALRSFSCNAVSRSSASRAASAVRISSNCAETLATSDRRDCGSGASNSPSPSARAARASCPTGALTRVASHIPSASASATAAAAEMAAVRRTLGRIASSSRIRRTKNTRPASSSGAATAM